MSQLAAPLVKQTNNNNPMRYFIAQCYLSNMIYFCKDIQRYTIHVMF